LRRNVGYEDPEFPMLFLYMPYLVFDAMLEVCAASVATWQLAKSGEPVIILMDEEPPPAAIAA
jgi:hypothetical protein